MAWSNRRYVFCGKYGFTGQLSKADEGTDVELVQPSAKTKSQMTTFIQIHIPMNAMVCSIVILYTLSSTVCPENHSGVLEGNTSIFRTDLSDNVHHPI